MPNESQITYTNRKGQKYYLCEVVQRSGKIRFVFSREPRGQPVTAMPDGYESAESIAGQVSLRKVGASPIPQTEVQWVRASMDRFPHLASYRVEARKKTIVIHEPQAGIDAGTLQDLGFDTRRIGKTPATSRYDPVFRFRLIDPEKRTFMPERMCYRSSLEGWLSLHTAGSLPSLADRYVKHLGKDSLFEIR